MSTLEKGEWWASRHGRCARRSTGASWVGGWLFPRAFWVVVDKRNISYLCGDSNLWPSDLELVTTQLDKVIIIIIIIIITPVVIVQFFNDLGTYLWFILRHS
jgi:hypothetical protein